MKKRLMRAAVGFAVVSILLGAFSLLDYFWYMDEEIEQQTIVELNKEMENQVTGARTVIEIQRNLLQTLANQIAASDSLGDKEKTMRTVEAALETEEFSRVGVTGMDGICHYIDSKGEGSCRISTKEYFRSTVERGEWYMGCPYTSITNTEEDCFVLAVPIKKDGEVQGVLHGAYNMERFAELLLSNWKGDDRGGFLIVGNGNVLVGYTVEGIRLLDEGNVFEMYKENTEFLGGSSLEEMRSNIRNGKNGYAQINSFGNRRYAAYRKLGYEDWYLFCVLPQAVVDSNYRFVRNATVLLVIKLILAGLMGLAAILIFRESAYSSLNEQKKQLEKSEERYRLLEEKSNEAFFEYDFFRQMLPHRRELPENLRAGQHCSAGEDAGEHPSAGSGGIR